jgi:hypothetical protein
MTGPRKLAYRQRKTEEDLATLYIEPSGLFHKLVRAAGLRPAVDFRDRDLRAMYFEKADLRGFNFSGSDLRGTRLRMAQRVDAATDFSRARLDPEDWEWVASSADVLPPAAQPSSPPPPPTSSVEQGPPIRGDERNDALRDLHTLRSEHRDLDTVIKRLTSARGADPLHLQRLKKRKLALKDEIAWLESRLIPD